MRPTPLPLTIIFPLEVTQDAIDSGTPVEATLCPIALELARDFFGVKVGSCDVELYFDGRYYNLYLNAEGRSFVHNFDCKYPVEPTVIGLECGLCELVGEEYP